MKRYSHPITISLCMILFFSALSCSNPDGNSAQLYETAQFEEAQDNLKHATTLYEEIIQSFPDSSLAPKAKERLEAIRKMSP